ncbi:MAG: adenosylcobinamide-GDP ribazoletransferase [Candidatus Rokubacteria bacterium]|nr:adenosylcobinamide-GDP ribazoletransferase [Candidatus Rokubacteria bacterium]
MTGLLVAARYLTIVPLPRGKARPHRDALGRAAPWFPVVGLGLGFAVVVVERASAWLFPPLLSALLTVTVWKLLTGGLHLDGLADCLDGLSGRDASHRLSIMSDSRIGAFGAIGLILFLLLEVAAVAELPAAIRWRALLVVPAIARVMPTLLARLHSAAKPDGQGAAFHDSVPWTAVPLGLGLALAGGVALLGAAGAVVVVVACLTALALGRFMAGRLGGITGDVLGAAVETGELAGLLTVAAWTHAAR